MRKKTVYSYNGDGFEESDIFCNLYDDPSWRSIFIQKDEFTPWKIACALNVAYERGRTEAFEDLRLLIGAEEKS